MCGFTSDFYDEIAVQNAYSAKDILQTLTLKDVERFLFSLGVSDIAKFDGYLVCPTICHNPLDEAESMKLYYYDENKSFHCYTQCSENFNIFELYRRYMELNHYKVSFEESFEYVKKFLTTDELIEVRQSTTITKNEKTKKVDFISLPKINDHGMDCFIPFYHPLWEKDGIGHDAMDKFNIRFSIKQNKIVIPHYDIDGKLIGIRARNINSEDVEIGKYMPIKVGQTLYNHQLGFNLYGINEHKEAIKRTKRAIIFESEKSVLLSETYYPGFSTAVATCGSQLNKFQINILVKKLGVNEIILAYDKEYKDLKDPKCRLYREKLIAKCKKYSGLANFYYLFDEHGLIQQKDSPIDRGQEVYEKLVYRKIKIN